MPTCLAGRTAPEADVRAHGTSLAKLIPTPGRLDPARAEQRLARLLMADAELRAALFRFVDVHPACTNGHHLVRHLHELLNEAQGSPTARRGAKLVGQPMLRRPVAVTARAGVRHVAKRFILGADAASAEPGIRSLWDAGVATTVDLLGEATVTEAEADVYVGRCDTALRELSRRAAGWPARPDLEHDRAGTLPRVNLSVKVSAMTTEMRAAAPDRGGDGAENHLRGLMRVAREVGAHLHVDMEAVDTRETITALTLRLLAEPEFRDGPSCGVVVQAYLVESAAHLDELLEWADGHPRSSPLTIRLVKGAYWDHEVVQAAQHGWAPPVFLDRRATDHNFEALTRTLLDNVPMVRAAIASHNLRSVAHAMAYADTVGLDRGDVEFQILRGLGDDLQTAIAASGRRVRCYSPAGDLVAGMAYLVRRLLENTANDSFLAAAVGASDLTTLLEAP